jgi:hypothetical protein
MAFFDRKTFMFFPMEHIMLPAHERCQCLADLTEEASPAAWGKMKVTWQASLGPWVMSCDVKMGDVKQEEKQE